MTDPFRAFYQNHIPDLSQISDLPHRHFRFLLPSGAFLKIKDRIRSGEGLRKWLVRYRPSDVYYSTSCWLVPENLGRREFTPLSDNVFLSSDIVFDLDRAPFSENNLELARRDTLKLLAFCEDQNLVVKYCAFSGSKGFHVVCEDPLRYDDPYPAVREDMAKSVRKEIVSRVLDEGIRIDATITTDTRRIIRVPGTINSKSGYICTVLTRDRIQEPVSTILKYIPRVNAGTPLIPAKGDDWNLRFPRMISWLCHRFGVRSKPAPAFSYSTYLVSSVPGIALQVPFFLFPPGFRQDRIEDSLKRVQEQYGLSDIYCYRSRTGIAAICLRTFPLRRLGKIIHTSGSANYGTLLKYHHLFFRIGETRDENRNLIAGPPEFLGILAASEENNARFISLPHYRFMQEFLPSIRNYKRMHGTGSVILTHTINEE